MPELDIGQVWEEVPGSNTNVDSFANVMSRRLFSDLAVHPMDPYIETYVVAKKLGLLTSEASLVDVGGSSGEFALNALRKLCVQPELYVVDPNFRPYAGSLEDYIKVKKLDPSKLHFIRGKGEDIELPSNSVSVATAMNAAFRADDLMAMIKSMQDVTEPGGLIGVSSNYLDNGLVRHHWTYRAATEVGRILGRQLPSFRPPAAKADFQHLPEILDEINGFQLLYVKSQKSRVKISEDDLFENLIWVIKMAGQQADLDTEEYSTWTEVVDTCIRPSILGMMIQPPDGGPRYCHDIVHRGVAMGINTK